jgi:hypothetical protein
LKEIIKNKGKYFNNGSQFMEEKVRDDSQTSFDLFGTFNDFDSSSNKDYC